MPFFTPAEMASVRRPLPALPQCGLCGLYKGCRSPKMPVAGKGAKGILVVGEAPGADEDDRGKPFQGRSGRLLRDELEKHGVDLFRDCWVTNALICFVGGVRVTSPSGVRKVFRRTYSGPLVRVNTLSGRDFTGTPNHPILTTSGWVALGNLKEGDDLVCHDGNQRTGNGGANVENPPPTFKEVFDTAANFGDVQRVVGSCVDFHGDGENGNVDIVGTNGLLWDRIESPFDQHSGQSPLLPANEGFGSLFGFGSANTNATALFGGALPATDGGVGGFGKSLATLGPNVGQADLHCGTLIANGDPTPHKEVFKSIERDAKALCQRLQSLPGVVSTDRIVKIEVDLQQQFFERDDGANGACHVYNLETEDGYYIVAGGIVVSNCRPPNNKIEDNKAVEYCRPNVVAALEKYKPEKVLLLGYSATVSVIGYLRTIEAFQDNMATWAGWRVPSQRLNAWVCPTSHPAHVLRADREPVVGIEWRHHIKKFCRLAGRPWKVVPDYAKEVKIEMDDRKAATILKMMAYEGDELLAFDYETNMRKPDHRDARIVSCAVSCGHTTVAYPWHGKAVEATAEILKGPNPKVAGNMKFEDRWTRARLGFPVNNLVHDTVLAAHVLDRREGITGVKFQAFVLLGQGDYDRAVDGYLHSEGGGNAKNRIKECDRKTLLLYNGIDARVEWEIAVRQRATRAVTKGTS